MSSSVEVKGEEEHLHKPPEVPQALPLDEIQEEFTRRDFEQIKALLLYEKKIPDKLSELALQYHNWRTCIYQKPESYPKLDIDRVLIVLGSLASETKSTSGPTSFERKLAIGLNQCSEYNAYIKALIQPQFADMLVDPPREFRHWFQDEVADPFSEVALLVRQWVVSHIVFTTECSCFLFEVDN